MAREKSRLERVSERRRQTTAASKERIGELGIRYGRTKDVVLAARQDLRQAKADYKVLRGSSSRSLKINPELLEGKKALDQAKVELAQAQAELRRHTPQAKYQASKTLSSQSSTHQESSDGPASEHSVQETLESAVNKVRLTEANYQEAQATYRKTKKRVTKEAQEKLAEAKEEVRVAKATQDEAVRRTGGSHRRRLFQTAKQSVHQQVSRTLNDVLQEDDNLADVSEARQKFTRAHLTVTKSKQVGKVAGASSKFVLTRSYNLGNRVYNKARGRGFTKTPKEFAWHSRLGANYRAWKKRVKQTDAAKTAKGAKKVAGWVVKPALAVLKNPLSFKAYVIMFLAAVLLALFSAGGSIAIQDEYDLNQTWIYLTKRDREKSTDKVDYWTNWEDPLLYVNHRYDEIRDLTNISEDRLMIDQLLGQAYLNTLWDDLNKDEENLKTMADLYTDQTSHYALDEEELEEYNELLENAKEIGKFSALQELGNPFYTSDSEQYEDPIKITKRFGYVTKDELDTTTTLYSSSGQELYAVMAGTVEVIGNDVVISDKDSRFTYKDVTGVVVRTGDQISEETLIGRSAGTSVVISYEKHIDTPGGNKEWTFVNPGFYFQHVTYTQATSVIKPVSMDGDKMKRIQRFAELIKQLIPEATDEGIASVLGGFDVESGVTFKRYEADYLTDYQFDKVAQSPTAENLMGSWEAFKGLYHIPLNDQGYLVNGQHYIGVGVGMWTGGRTLALWEFARANGLDIWSEEAQVRFLLEGDNPYYIKIFREAVTSSADTNTTTQFFLDNWLGVPGNKLLERQNSAKQILNLLKRPGLAGDYSHIFNVPYKVIQPYGPTPWSLGGGAWMYPKGYHDGIDLVPVSGDFGATDVPVFSATNGTVHTKYGTDLGGYAIIIKTDFGGYVYYGHLKRMPDIAVGTEVKKGDPIAILGNTGAYGIYHVHLAYNENTPDPTANDDRDPSFLILKDGSVTQDQIITP